MASYYGVVLKSGKTGLFTSWPAAQDFIRTNPSGALYKKFNSQGDAEAYVQNILAGSSSAKSSDTRPETSNQDISPEHAVAYVDGSFNPAENKWGFGVVLFPSDNPGQISTDSGFGTAYAHARNVTGEIYGAMKAVNMAIKHGFKRITIYHDYQGISAWATGAWQANQELTRKYRDWINGKTDFIDIFFVKVTGHTGVKFNEMADELAKAGCGMS